MIIAIPTADGRLCPHFGHCRQFAFVEADPQTRQIGSVRYLDPPAHEPGVLPRWLSEQGADVVIAGGMGQRARGLLDAQGVQVVVGATATPPAEAARAYLDQTLEVGENACDH
jgi:predicted Fe-Mo cluster-binding NifX family protein